MDTPIKTTIDPTELRGVARGTTQRSILNALSTTPEGIWTSDLHSSPTQTRHRWSAGYHAWTGMLPRLTAALRQRGVQVTHLGWDGWRIEPLTAATLVRALITEPDLRMPQDVTDAVLVDWDNRAHHDREDELLVATTFTYGRRDFLVLRTMQALRKDRPDKPLAELIPTAQTICHLLTRHALNHAHPQRTGEH
jgi:hypothetical protein